jgi:hypothetical protein
MQRRLRKPPLDLDAILRWADAHRDRTGAWPHSQSGPVAGQPGLTWHKIDRALKQGHRGLPGSSSIARLLQDRRGVRNPARLPPLNPDAIVAWARAHRKATGRWPTTESGPVPGADGETWAKIAWALRHGCRGLPGGVSLARFLAERAGARTKAALPRFSEAKVRRWARAHRRRTGRWPAGRSGPIPECPGETWLKIDWALRNGLRGLKGGSSLARLIAEAVAPGRGPPSRG